MIFQALRVSDQIFLNDKDMSPALHKHAYDVIIQPGIGEGALPANA